MTVAAVQKIVVVAAVQFVMTVAAIERIVSIPAVQVIMTVAAVQTVVAVPAVQVVMTVAAVQTVVAVPAEQDVVPAPAEYDVVSVSALQEVVAAEAVDPVGEIGTGDGVGGARPLRPQMGFDDLRDVEFGSVREQKSLDPPLSPTFDHEEIGEFAQGATRVVRIGEINCHRVAVAVQANVFRGDSLPELDHGIGRADRAGSIAAIETIGAVIRVGFSFRIDGFVWGRGRRFNGRTGFSLRIGGIIVRVGR